MEKIVREMSWKDITREEKEKGLFPGAYKVYIGMTKEHAAVVAQYDFHGRMTFMGNIAPISLASNQSKLGEDLAEIACGLAWRQSKKGE